MIIIREPIVGLDIVPVFGLLRSGNIYFRYRRIGTSAILSHEHDLILTRVLSEIIGITIREQYTAFVPAYGCSIGTCIGKGDLMADAGTDDRIIIRSKTGYYPAVSAGLPGWVIEWMGNLYGCFSCGAG